MNPDPHTDAGHPQGATVTAAGPRVADVVTAHGPATTNGAVGPALSSVATATTDEGAAATTDEGAAATTTVTGDSGAIGVAPPPGDSAARGLVLLAVLVSVCVMTVRNGGTGWLLMIGAIALMILLHEAGHYVAAKASGMKVTQFFLGFGPRLWSFRRGETEYGVKALPLGGYVRIVGMHNLDKVDPVDEPRSYRQASFPRRLAVAGAGSAVHAVIAFVLLFLLFGPLGFAGPSTRIDVVGEQSAAEAAGLREGDRIVALDGVPVDSWESLVDKVRVSAGTPLQLTVERDGARRTVTATPAARTLEDGTSVGRLGLLPQAEIVHNPALSALGKAARLEGTLAKESITSFGAFFRPSSLQSYSQEVTRAATGSERSPGTAADNRPVSVVGATKIGVQAYEEDGFRQLLWLVALVNISIGVLNMIPLLPLDGGHVAIAVYERIRSRRGRRYRVDVMKLLPLTYAVVAVLIALGVSSMYLDIVRPVDPNREPATSSVPPSSTPNPQGTGR